MDYLAFIPGNYLGGCEDYSFRIIDFVSSQGWNAHCIVSSIPVYQKAIQFVPSERVYLIDACFGPEFIRPRSLTELVRLRSLKRSYRKLLKTINPNVIHANLPWHYHSFFFLEVCSSARLPILVTFQLVAPNRPPHWRQVDLMGRILSTGVVSLMAISNNNRELLAEYYRLDASQIKVIPNRPRDLPLNHFLQIDERKIYRVDLLAEFNLPKNSIFILTVSSLYYQKGIDLLLCAAKLLCSRFPQIYFLIAGDGPERLNLEDSSRVLGLTSNVLFLGHRNDIDRLLTVANIFLFPSRFEGESFALLEAARSGLPIVASKASGIPETFRDGVDALLFPVENPTEIANQVTRLLLDPLLARTIAENAQQRISTFSESDMLNATILLLESISHQRI